MAQKTVPAGEGNKDSEVKSISLNTPSGSLMITSGPLSALPPSEGHPYGDDGMTLNKPGSEGHPYGEDGLIIPTMLKPVRNDNPPTTDKSTEPESKQKYDDGGVLLSGVPAPGPNPRAVENLKRQITEVQTSTAQQIERIENQLKKDTERLNAQKEELQKKIQALDLKISEVEARLLEVQEELTQPNLSKKDKLRLMAEKNRLENQKKQSLLQKRAHEKRIQQMELMKQGFSKKAEARIAVVQKESTRRISNLEDKIGMLLKKALLPVI